MVFGLSCRQVASRRSTLAAVRRACVPAWLRAGLLLSLCLVAGGCGFLNEPTVPEPRQARSPVLAFMLDTEPGATTILNDPDFGGSVRVTTGEAFVSATGAACRRATLLSPGQDAEIVVTCQDSEGVWTMGPRIWGQGL